MGDVEIFSEIKIEEESLFQDIESSAPSTSLCDQEDKSMSSKKSVEVSPVAEDTKQTPVSKSLEERPECPMNDLQLVFMDHSYSLYKDVDPIYKLLQVYQSNSKENSEQTKVESSISAILKLLGIVVSSDCDEIIESTVSMIDIYMDNLRQIGKKETNSENIKPKNSEDDKLELAPKLKNVFETYKVLNTVQEVGNSLINESRSVAERISNLSKPENDNKEHSYHSLENKDDNKLEIDKILKDLQLSSEKSILKLKPEVTVCETQTDNALELISVECQTENTSPFKKKFEFSSSDLDTDVSLTSRRKKKRKKRSDLIKSMLEGHENDNLQTIEPSKKPESENKQDETDDEINKLVNFSNLERDVEDQDLRLTNGPSSNTLNKPKKDDAMDILNDIILNESDSTSESLDDLPNEMEFLKDLNLTEKQRLLCSSSSDTISDQDEVNGLLEKVKKTNVKDSGEESVDENVMDLFLTEINVDMNSKSKKKQDNLEKENDINVLNGSIEATDSRQGETITDKNSSDENSNRINEPQNELSASPAISDNINLESVKQGENSRQDSPDCEILDDTVLKAKANKNCTKEQLDAFVIRSQQRQRRRLLEMSSSSRDADYISLSSDSDLEEPVEDEVDEEPQGQSRKMRRMLSDDQLEADTKRAQRDENERIKRLEKKQDMMKKYLANKSTKGEIILDVISSSKKEIKVHPEIVKHLKKHQIDGIKFMYDCSYGSVEDVAKYPGSGSILAHCMGLGKTLQFISIVHTVIQYPELQTNRILVICPKSTVMNWVDELERWLSPIQTGTRLKVFFMPDQADLVMKLRILQQWSKCGQSGYAPAGVMLLGYEAFRILILNKIKKLNSPQAGPNDKLHIKLINETLLEPGADLVICDEGHIIKNRNSAINKAVSKIKTRRRIILTGTPIQNNLKEYYCMVNFIKPSFLGTEKEFANLYVNPILHGQHKDSNKNEIKCMKQRSYVLHKKLSRFVQRKEAAVLKEFLPEKYEYVLFIPLTNVQERLYEFFLNNNPLKEFYGGKTLIADYTFLRKIWTHPKVLEIAFINAVAAKEKKEREKRIRESDDEVPDDVLDRRIGMMSVTSDWWREHLGPDDLESLYPSNKLRIMFEILKLCQQNGEKCLIFSAFVAVLNVVEHFLGKIGAKDANAQRYGLDRFSGPWEPGRDYFRLDGKTSKSSRHAMVTRFNDPTNTRVKCFLISARAGGQGINLTGANRVIILDTSWNPSNDQQNIFRIFRLGQKKKCYVYRLLAMGTMEEKVYSRSVTKQAMSFRVVDEQQIDRHYSMAELAELYVLTKTDFTNRPVPNRPDDNLLANLLHCHPNLIYKYHVHDSLLENKPEQDLSEADKRDAWHAFENDLKVQKNGPEMPNFGPFSAGNSIYGNFGQSLAQLGYGMGSGTLATGYGPSSNFNSNMSPGYFMNQFPYGSDPMLLMNQLYNSPNTYNSYLNNGYYMSGSLFPSSTATSTTTSTAGLPALMSSPDSTMAGGLGRKRDRPKATASRTEGLSTTKPGDTSWQRRSSASPSQSTNKPDKPSKYSYYDPGMLSLLSMDLPPTMKDQLRHFSRAALSEMAQKMKPPNPSPPILNNSSNAISRGLSPSTTITSSSNLNTSTQNKNPGNPVPKLPDFSSINPPKTVPPPTKNYLGSVPPTTTIEKVNLNREAPLDLQKKSPNIKVLTATNNKPLNSSPVTFSSVQKKKQKPVKLSLSNSLRTSQPSAIINLIDDMSESRPNLTVKPVPKSAEVSSITTSVIRSTATGKPSTVSMANTINATVTKANSTNISTPIKNVVKNVNMGIKYPSNTPLQSNLSVANSTITPVRPSIKTTTVFKKSDPPPLAKCVEVIKGTSNRQNLIANLNKVPNSITLTPIPSSANNAKNNPRPNLQQSPTTSLGNNVQQGVRAVAPKQFVAQNRPMMKKPAVVNVIQAAQIRPNIIPATRFAQNTPPPIKANQTAPSPLVRAPSVMSITPTIRKTTPSAIQQSAIKANTVPLPVPSQFNAGVKQAPNQSKPNLKRVSTTQLNELIKGIHPGQVMTTLNKVARPNNPQPALISPGTPSIANLTPIQKNLKKLQETGKEVILKQ